MAKKSFCIEVPVFIGMTLTRLMPTACVPKQFIPRHSAELLRSALLITLLGNASAAQKPAGHLLAQGEALNCTATESDLDLSHLLYLKDEACRTLL